MAGSAPLVAIRLPAPAAAVEVVRVWQAGAAVLPLDPGAPDAEVRRTLVLFKPTELVTDAGRSALPDGVPVEDGVAAVVPTSGTSGTPKGVELSAAGIEASCRAVMDALAAGPEDRWLCCVPLRGVAGLTIVARAWHLGTGLAVHAGFDVEAIAAAREATLISLVPTQLQRLLDARVDLARFRHVLLGGAPAPAALIEAAALRGVPVVTTYGLTETFGGVVHDGHPLEGVEVRIAADGEIWVKGPMVLRRYRFEPVATAAALRNGWLHTGDTGWLDADRRLVVSGRKDDLIQTGGVSVQPAEVEGVLATHPEVLDVAVGRRADREWGERVVAFVVPRDPGAPPTLADLRGFARRELAVAKAPRELVLVPSIPRTPTGKILRGKLPAAVGERL